MAEPRILRGVMLVMAAVLAFAFADVLTKHLTTAYAVALVVAGRYIINLGLLGALYAPRHGAAIWQTQRTGLVILRGSCLTLASLTMGLALRTMPLGETITIIYLSPFAVMLLAGPVLGEKVSVAGWIGALIAFAGVVLILRPGGHLDPVGVALSLVNAGLATGYSLLTRVLARTETMMAMLLYTALVGVVVFVGLLPFTGIGTLPGLVDSGLIVLLGGLATLGHFLFTAAYREAPASVLAPVNYFHLVWGAILGWLVFDHLPDRISLFGMGLVVLAGMAVAVQARWARG